LLKAESTKPKAFFQSISKMLQVKHIIGCKALALPKNQILLKDNFTFKSFVLFALSFKQKM